MIYELPNELILEKLQSISNKEFKSGIHFTSKKNFYNIIKNGEIFFSDLFEVNDQDEIKFGKETLLSHLTLKYDIKLSHIQELFSLKETFKRQIFVFCLAYEQRFDSLQHWAMYGDNCNGVGLKINIENVLKIIESNFSAHFIKYVFPVQYFNEKNVNVTSPSCKIENFLSDAGEIIFDIYKNIDFKNTTNDNYQKKNLIKTIFLLFSSMIKKQFWKTEKEIRIAVFPQIRNMVKYNIESNKIYFPFNFVESEYKIRSLLNKYKNNVYSYSKDNEKLIYKKQIIDAIKLGPKNKEYELDKISFLLDEFDLRIPLTKSIGNYS